MSGGQNTAPLANPLQGVPEHIRALLSRLHGESLAQEAALEKEGMEGKTFGEVMRDKFIALEEDKAQYIYELCRAINAKTIVEAGTSYGVSTIYLALAVAANVAAAGGNGIVVATEHEPTKANKAREYWQECGQDVTRVIDLREGDLRETLKENLENVDFLLLDIWTPMALPTLQVVQPKLRHGAVIIADNTISSAGSYGDFFAYIRDPKNGFINVTLPFKGGLEMSVYLPQQA
ncbi:putative o- protein [Phaeoacremonium minimum UCRPA7]|uniref:Putative o-protein n=1 Tax=Phaeoacremonium minimum (strain UCR-PA7) TaxID=1286976 RepID=R8BLL8_PHAM7|nr:putative o- protein [Phaeoacremonium minimum UCRPA7]EOO00244.1 putative o- protein [Phaeoacremonium minimum UCRPA7]